MNRLTNLIEGCQLGFYCSDTTIAFILLFIMGLLGILILIYFFKTIKEYLNEENAK